MPPRRRPSAPSATSSNQPTLNFGTQRSNKVTKAVVVPALSDRLLQKNLIAGQSGLGLQMEEEQKGHLKEELQKDEQEKEELRGEQQEEEEHEQLKNVGQLEQPQGKQEQGRKRKQSDQGKKKQQGDILVAPLSDSTPKPESTTSRAKATEPSTAELVIREQVEALGEEEDDTETAEERRADEVTPQQIKRYWAQKEATRKAPRVHQRMLSLHDKILREFDLSSQYGPCIGIERSKRWQRAESLGLKPPIEVFAVLQKEDATKNPKIQRAYIDDLLSRSAAED